MLVNVKLVTDHTLAGIFAAMGQGGPILHRGTGIYECPHFNFGHEFDSKWPKFENNYPELHRKPRLPAPGTDAVEAPPEWFGCYGVCDNIEQVLEQCVELDPDHPVAYVLNVTPVRREDQSPSGGWRWHKWGEYIGTHTPQCEYLYDEKGIDMVYCYHIFKVKPESIDHKPKKYVDVQDAKVKA